MERQVANENETGGVGEVILTPQARALNSMVNDIVGAYAAVGWKPNDTHMSVFELKDIVGVAEDGSLRVLEPKAALTVVERVLYDLCARHEQRDDGFTSQIKPGIRDQLMRDLQRVPGIQELIADLIADRRADAAMGPSYTAGLYFRILLGDETDLYASAGMVTPRFDRAQVEAEYGSSE